MDDSGCDCSTKRMVKPPGAGIHRIINGSISIDIGIYLFKLNTCGECVVFKKGVHGMTHCVSHHQGGSQRLIRRLSMLSK